MVTLADRQYTLADFEVFSNQLGGPLPDKIKTQIQFLAEKVGAPTYSKTPNFKRRGNKRARYTPAQWEAMRNFKPTKIEKSKDKQTILIDRMLLLLNKLTEKNYETISLSIINLMKEIKKEDDFENSLLQVGESIFTISSNNSFYSKLYAKLYKDLITNFPFMQGICEENFDKFTKLFENIEVVSTEEDYDYFCKINKKNEDRRSVSHFFVNLMLREIISIDKISAVVLHLISKQEKLFQVKDKKKVVDELAENIFIIVYNGYNLFKTCKDWESISVYLKHISSISPKTYPSLTNKTVFKYLDIIEKT